MTEIMSCVVVRFTFWGVEIKVIIRWSVFEQTVKNITGIVPQPGEIQKQSFCIQSYVHL